MRMVTLEDSGQGKGPGSQARPRSGYVHAGQEQPQLSRGQAACVTERSLRNWGKGLGGGVSEPYQLRHGAREASSTGRGLPGPRNPRLSGLEGPSSGILPALSCNSHQERRAKVTFPIFFFSPVGSMRPNGS